MPLRRVLTIIRIELVKMYRQRGTYAGYALLAAFIGLFVWGVWVEGPPTGDIGRRMGDEIAVGGDPISGPLIPYIMLVQVPVAVDIFIPLLISMIAGGIIAGDLQRGTLRATLTRPVERWAIVIGKVCASFIHTASLVVFLGTFAVLLGYIVFGPGDIITFDEGLRIFPEGKALAKLALSYGVSIGTMWAVAAVAIFCSTIFEHPLTASGVTVGFLIVSGMLMVIPYFDWLEPYLLTTHFHPFKHIFRNDMDWAGIAKDLGYTSAYCLAAIGGTLAVFCRKDMTC